MPTMTTEARAALKTARANDQDLNQWAREIIRETAQLWRISGESNGYLLTRVEEIDRDRLELVLIAGSGENARPVIQWARQLAEAHQIDSIRTHITRPGLQRIYESEGWHEAERIMRIKTDGR